MHFQVHFCSFRGVFVIWFIIDKC